MQDRILASIGSFRRESLKPSVTTVTTDDGKVLVEQLGEDGIFQTHQVGQRTNEEMSYLTPTNILTKKGTHIDTSPVERLQVDDPKMVEFLRDNGYVVVQVADENQVQEAKTKLWDCLESTLNWNRDDPRSWTMPHDTCQANAGIIHGSDINHSELQWYIRCLPKVRRASSNIWKDQVKGAESDAHEQLLTSFDGINVFRPWQHSKKWKTRDGWTHVDQGPKLQGFHGVQGLVTLLDASATQTGGFVCMPGSHYHHSTVIDLESTSDRNFCRIPLDSRGLPPELHHQLRFVAAKAGDLVLWDSRTIHANIPALERPSMDEKDILRAACYVFMTPKCLATPEVLQERRLAFEHKIGTGHWPHLPPNRHGDDEGSGEEHNLVDTPRLNAASEEIRELVG